MARAKRAATTGATLAPIAVEPVALTRGTWWLAASAAPTDASPSTTCARCAGASIDAAARSNIAWVASAVSGVRSLGFQITLLPHTTARAAFQLHTATGKLNAVMTATGP